MEKFSLSVPIFKPFQIPTILKCFVSIKVQNLPKVAPFVTDQTKNFESTREYCKFAKYQTEELDLQLSL